MKKMTNRRAAKATPIETGLPGSESYARNVQGDLYDLTNVVISLSSVASIPLQDSSAQQPPD
jgi:hypothetical protein